MLSTVLSHSHFAPAVGAVGDEHVDFFGVVPWGSQFGNQFMVVKWMVKCSKVPIHISWP